LRSEGSKLVAILLITVVVAAGFGYWVLAPKMPSQVATYTTQQTSLLTSSQSIASTSISSTTLTSETGLWINVSATRPVSYYLGLLQSNQTEPYMSLAREMAKLPDLTNATAVAKITYLALNATNPEVKEAFQLIIKGGTPDPRDFTYTVPSYNTELQVLYWLALQNDFKKDDTLALTIAMVNGLWVTMGNEQVKQAVRDDSTQLLRYFRETNELQRQQGYYQLEEYPLEAKLCLAWTGNITPAFGEYGLSAHRFSRDYTVKRVDLTAYYWDTLNTTELSTLKSWITKNIHVVRNVGDTIGNLEHFWYFDRSTPSNHNGGRMHWDYANEQNNEKQVVIDGTVHKNWYLFNVGGEFRFFLQNGYMTGGCADETAVIDGFAKSIGIATTALWHQEWGLKKDIGGHMFVIFYDPNERNWRAFESQLEVSTGPHMYEYPSQLYLLKSPINQKGYLRLWAIDNIAFAGGMFYLGNRNEVLYSQIANMFSSGVPTSQMKQWLLYS